MSGRGAISGSLVAAAGRFAAMRLEQIHQNVSEAGCSGASCTLVRRGSAGPVTLPLLRSQPQEQLRLAQLQWPSNEIHAT